MKRIDDVISITELGAMSERMYGSLVKTDVDLVRNILVVDITRSFVRLRSQYRLSRQG